MRGRHARRVRRGLLRSYEKPMLFVCAMLTLVLLSLLALPRYEKREGDAEPPEAAGREAREARGGGSRREPPSVASSASSAGPKSLLCAPLDELLYLDGESAAAAADRLGHFTFYANPDPRTGRPTRDSHQILGDCAPALTFSNYASLQVEGFPAEPAGASNLLAPTGRTADGSLVSTFRFDGGVVLRQELRMEGDALRISHRLTNTSEQERAATLRSLLTPPMAGEDQKTLFRAPALEDAPEEAGSPEVRRERSLLGRWDQIHPVEVPRRAAVSDSSARWDYEGRSPDTITFAGFLQLARTPMLYEDIRLAWPLPKNASMAVYWQDLALPPGGGVEVAHTYEFSPEAADEKR